MNDAKFYKDKVVIITGASSGIGKALSLRLAGYGAKVILAARSEDKLKALQDKITASGSQSIYLKTDISVREDVAKLVKAAIGEWDRVDIFISNAGQYVQGFIKDVNDHIFTQSIEVNFFGAFYGVKEILPVFECQKSGSIVFINTLDAKKGIISDGPYVAAKSALDGFADVLRQEVKGSGISVISVYPGRIDTPMIADLKAPWISPKLSVERAVSAVVKGIKKDKPVIVIPKIFYPLGALNNCFPRLMDWFYKQFSLEGKRSP